MHNFHVVVAASERTLHDGSDRVGELGGVVCSGLEVWQGEGVVSHNYRCITGFMLI